ncbi:hypothetical protein B0H14DRAFT_2516838 [Mycena olivaceomarginata]|nr:hypothetical protein B0H14DRAFT_2516838 [Mycena olivaceomarginata]
MQNNLRCVPPSVPPFVIPARGCDPFLTDVYCLGTLIRTDRKLEFDFMCPLVTDMVQADPSQRPNTDEAVQRLNKIVGGLSSWKLCTRVFRRQTCLSSMVSCIGSAVST